MSLPSIQAASSVLENLPVHFGDSQYYLLLIGTSNPEILPVVNKVFFLLALLGGEGDVQLAYP